MKKFSLIFLFIIFYAGYLIFTKLLFGEDNLITIKGLLPQHRALIRSYKAKEQGIEFAYLVFRLKNDERLFTLRTDISGVANGERVFDGVAYALKQSGMIELKIRKAEIASPKPKVFEIYTDTKKVFEILKKPANNSSLCLFLLLILLLFCSSYYLLIGLEIPEKKPRCKRKWAF